MGVISGPAGKDARVLSLVAAAFIAVMSFANLATMAIPKLERGQEAVIARIADVNAELTRSENK